MSIVDSSNGFGRIENDKPPRYVFNIVAALILVSLFVLGYLSAELRHESKVINSAATPPPVTSNAPVLIPDLGLPKLPVAWKEPVSSKSEVRSGKLHGQITLGVADVAIVSYPSWTTTQGEARYENMRVVTMPNGLICVTYVNTVSCIKETK